MSEVHQGTAHQDEAPATVRRLVHDVTNALSVVTLGLHALQFAREDAEQFDEVYATIQDDGVIPLKEHLATLVEMLLESQEDRV